jgi:poly(A) polymerase
MLRIIRFAAKLGFTIEKKSEAPIYELKDLLSHVPSARLFDEYLKLFLSGYSYLSFCLLRRYDFISILFPQTETSLKEDENKQHETFIYLALKNTDKRYAEEKPIAPAFLLAVLLWPAVEKHYKNKLAMGIFESQAFYEACSEVVSDQQKSVAIPRRLTQIIRDVWFLQHRLARRQGKRAFQTFLHPKFRAGYDFCLLRAEAGDNEAKELSDWWTQFIASNEQTRGQMAAAMQKGDGKAKSRRGPRKGPRKMKKTEETL